MEKYIKIQEGYPKSYIPVEIVDNDGNKHEAYWCNILFSWRSTETGIPTIQEVEKWKYL